MIERLYESVASALKKESVETVIDLVDQVHTLRRQLHQLGEAIGRQSPETREAIAVALKDLRES